MTAFMETLLCIVTSHSKFFYVRNEASL